MYAVKFSDRAASGNTRYYYFSIDDIADSKLDVEGLHSLEFWYFDVMSARLMEFIWLNSFVTIILLDRI